MLEAWLLADEAALRRAAGNPNGAIPLSLPRLDALEHIPDPKALLNDLIKEASGLSGRRRKRLHLPALASRVADLTDDFSPLRALPAFPALEAEIERWASDR